MALPPLESGAVKPTLACAFPAVATGLVGGPGTAQGVTAADGAEGLESPAALMATTVKV